MNVAWDPPFYAEALFAHSRVVEKRGATQKRCIRGMHRRLSVLGAETARTAPNQTEEEIRCWNRALTSFCTRPGVWRRNAGFIESDTSAYHCRYGMLPFWVVKEFCSAQLRLMIYGLGTERLNCTRQVQMGMAEGLEAR